MEKIIQIAGQDVGFKAPASFPIRYRNETGRDIFYDLQLLLEGVETVEVPKKKKTLVKRLADKATETGEDTQEYESRLTEKWDTSVFFGIAHTMARTFDPKVTPSILDWVDSFEEFPVFVVFKELQDLLNGSLKVSKK